MNGLKNYEEVKDRIPLFWEKHPSGRIATTIISDLTDINTIVFRADLYSDKDDPTPFSTGYASETVGVGGMANKFSHVENCETSAIGRALSNANLYNRNMPRPSAEEMAKVKRGENEKKGEPFLTVDPEEKKEPIQADTLKRCTSMALKLDEVRGEEWSIYREKHPKYKETQKNAESAERFLKALIHEQELELKSSAGVE
tara:strand:- start:775 stop:1374 length:600 start_codon:yes stop_codon:yes gene_type:complete